MKKLCIDARMLYASGIGTYLQNLIPDLSHHFDLLALGYPSELYSLKEKNYCNFQILPVSLPIYSIAEVVKLPFKIPLCDIFWSPHYNVPLLPIRAKKRVVTIHDVFHLAHYHELSLKQKIYTNLHFNAATKLNDLIITVSEFSKSEILKYTKANANSIKVIYNGINHVLFRKIEDSKRLKEVRQTYHLPSHFILFVGNVKPHKNLKNLLLAFNLVKENIPDYKLVIVGKKEGFITADPTLFHFIKNEKLEEKILFTDFVPINDLPVIYNLASLFVFPSLYEGFGLPPLEALSCGCPVIVSDRASMPEICGKAVTYFDPELPEEIGQAILRKLKLSRADRILEQEIKRIVSFRWHEAILNHKNVLNDLF